MEENRSIYLSPSLQEWNIGANDYGTEEQRMNQVADVVERELRNRGFMVYRNKPEQTLKEVVDESNMLRPSIHVAIHSNASGGEATARGPEIYTNRPDTSGDRLALDIYDEIEKIYPDKEASRGVIYTNSLYEVKNTLAPSALLEVAFHDNPEDAKWIIDNIENIGRAIAKGIENYFVGLS
ncbi:MAG: N-acetylmuramoyl-L-alanine amidase [Clostridia bacterium]|nr:N-acetylmuramoyl-L-alanine amidase [Clostridia bacterium]